MRAFLPKENGRYFFARAANPNGEQLGRWWSFSHLQPKSGFLPEAGRGGTEFLGPRPGRGERCGVSSAKATFKAEPVS
jgi:hypothetical protein